MRSPDELVHSRARVRQRYALLPLEGFPPSRLPGWADCEVRVLAAPALGAQFVEYLIDIPPGKGTEQSDAAEQVFGYLLSGAAHVAVGGREHDLRAGGFFYVPQEDLWSLRAHEPAKLLLLRKRYESSQLLRQNRPPAALIGAVNEVPATPFADNPHTRLQMLIPDEIQYDFAMNIFTFDSGHALPYVETHVMEHGLYFLEGKGMYYLDGEWMEVQKDDFIWMRPYCPQSFYATGPSPAKYLYYKNVNREMSL